MDGINGRIIVKPKRSSSRDINKTTFLFMIVEPKLEMNNNKSYLSYITITVHHVSVMVLVERE